ncbi:MAG: hypothetical protein JWN23_537 [Rhodocyclales bacterium]|nr:hypothetical protein [Rhodocyclales bacterium]
MNILILGGYGIFGGRLAFLLAEEASLTLLIAGRSLGRASQFCDTLPPGAQKRALLFDRNADVEQQLRTIEPDLVVDATGPFQSYGEAPYRVVEACIACGIHYMDLADGSDFVTGIHQFNAAAKARGIHVLAGVSSFPVLTAAVVRRLSRGMASVRTITGGIAPSPYAGVGLNVIRAIASYAGKRVVLIRDGRQSHSYALTETMRYTICPPGRLPLHNIRFSLVDVPDLQVLPHSWPDLDAIWMGAGPVPEILHRMLNGLAWLVRRRLLPSLSPFARPFHFAINVLRWGEHRGGMFVSVRGVGDNGETLERSWHLLAEGDHGPLIPSMAIEAIVRRSLAGTPPAPGARPATHELELEDYENIFRQRTIYSGQREASQASSDATLYQRILGEAWSSLPEPLQTMHGWVGGMTASGLAKVERGDGLLARIVARLFRFPLAGQDIPVRVAFQMQGKHEHWQRTFGDKSFSSLQGAGCGRADKLLVERFGPFLFGLALVIADQRLHLIVRQWRFLGIPLPVALAPGGQTYEYVSNSRFCFHVEINHRLIGLIVRYQGWLSPA